MAKGMLIDLTKCVGCRGCQVACKEWNELPAEPTTWQGSYENPPELKWNTYTKVRFVEGETNGHFFWRFVKTQCMHCLEPACVSACPVGAMVKTNEGPVIYDEKKCMGCRYCMLACPFQVPKFEWHLALPSIKKCVFCFDRISAGKKTACSTTCPSKALEFGEYNDILKIAEDRITKNPDKYINYIYGKDEVGGTSWLYISGIPFEELGFRMDLPKRPLPAYTWTNLSKVPWIAGIGVVVLGGLWFICHRREEVQQSK